ncbi:M48 family metallopeptidase [Candidatus Micrarchaeota archaeon]|nr:M48 family metallopeptidase [Candidatus Micrarchaeota archaeon]
MNRININGRDYPIETAYTANKTAIAKLKNGTIIITIPSRWSKKEKLESYESLLKRSVHAIACGRWTDEGSKKLTFHHGQILRVMGKTFRIFYAEGKRFGSKLLDGDIHVTVADHPRKDEKAAAHIRKQIVNEIMPGIKERVSMHNAYFNADIRKIRITDNLTLWGTCSHDNSAISLNFRLLFMPERVLDYVIVHELAHTKYKSHGKRFWSVVGKIMPDHAEQRKWLRENGWSVFSRINSGQQKITRFL